jgi:hypothetical protein
MIKNSLEWSTRRDELKQQIQSLPYNRELRTMLSNIDSMVTILGGSEVVARRTKKSFSELEELQRVNSAIDTLEQWIIMGRLLA